MIKVKVKLFPRLSTMSSNTVEMVLEDGATIMTLIQQISFQYGCELERQVYDPKTDQYMVEFIVNNKHELPNAALKDGDEVAILPFAMGG